MEEYEKNDSRVPAWKVEWVRSNLEHMIGKEDKGGRKSTIKARKSMAKKAQTNATIVEEEESEECDMS